MRPCYSPRTYGTAESSDAECNSDHVEVGPENVRALCLRPSCGQLFKVPEAEPSTRRELAKDVATVVIGTVLAEEAVRLRDRMLTLPAPRTPTGIPVQASDSLDNWQDAVETAVSVPSLVVGVSFGSGKVVQSEG